MMKSIRIRNPFIALFIASFLLFPFTGVKAAAASDVVTETPDVGIIIEGQRRTYQQVCIIVNGSTFLPLRALASDLGIPNDDAHIIWNQSEKSVTLKSADGGKEIYLQIGNLDGRINGASHKLNAAPVLYKNSTYIPVRFVADALDMHVYWDNAERKVYIKNAEDYNRISEILQSWYIAGSDTDSIQCEYLQETASIDSQTNTRALVNHSSGTVDYNLKDMTFTDVAVTESGDTKETIKYVYDGSAVDITMDGNPYHFTDKTQEQVYIISTFSKIGVYPTDLDLECISDDDNYVLYTTGNEYHSFSKTLPEYTGETLEMLSCLFSLSEGEDHTEILTLDSVDDLNESDIGQFLEATTTYTIDKATCQVKAKEIYSKLQMEDSNDGAQLLEFTNSMVYNSK